MSLMKRLIDDCCFLYEQGYNVNFISADLNIKIKLVEKILYDYCDMYREDLDILARAEEIEIYNQFG